jgi:UDP-N-acetylglucosamine 3-dehydrogenase
MTLRVAVIGAGSMGRNHARVFLEIPDTDLIGVADRDETVAREITHRYGGDAYTDYKVMLDEIKPDAVTIAVPTLEHLDVARAVIERGIHLFVEKPIASSVEEGEKMIAAAEAAKVQLMVGHIERFNPAVSALKERLDSGELGRVFELDARRQGPFPARIRDVGVVIDLAVHDVDVMRYVSGSDVVRVYAETERQIHSTYEICSVDSSGWRMERSAP